MALFGKLFNKKEVDDKPKGFHELTVEKIESTTADSRKITFAVPSELKSEFDYVPGQYLVLALQLNGKSERRSYSICSAKNEGLSIGVKTLKGGLISEFLNNQLSEGDTLYVSKPEGAFTIPAGAKNIVAIAAGSGITPILSMAKEFKGDGSFRLFYANRTEKDIMFKGELDALNVVSKTYFLSQEDKEGYEKGRLDKHSFSKIIQSDLSLLKSDVFLLCGPQEMILGISEQLKTFGVSKDKIRFELFTPPVKEEKVAKKEVNDFKGISKVTVELDGDFEILSVRSDQVILDVGIEEGMDLPYSCKGGVCCTCKAKILEGKVHMRLNYSLTDKEVEQGYILSCQSQPASEIVKITYDV